MMVKILIAVGLLISVMVLACGPVASPGSGDGSSGATETEPMPTTPAYRCPYTLAH